MSSLDKILEPMKDGEWHTLEELNRRVGLSEGKLQEIVRFFADYNFVQLDEKHGRARLTPPIRTFLTKTQRTNLEG